jgi:hypothetical protein
MQVRGFSGTWTLAAPAHLGRSDIQFLIISSAYLAGLLLMAGTHIFAKGGL